MSTSASSSSRSPTEKTKTTQTLRDIAYSRGFGARRIVRAEIWEFLLQQPTAPSNTNTNQKTKKQNILAKFKDKALEQKLIAKLLGELPVKTTKASKLGETILEAAKTTQTDTAVSRTRTVSNDDDNIPASIQQDFDAVYIPPELKHKLPANDLHVIEADVKRSCFSWDIHKKESELPIESMRLADRQNKRNTLIKLLGEVLVEEKIDHREKKQKTITNTWKYYQGFHDICLVFLETMSTRFSAASSVRTFIDKTLVKEFLSPEKRFDEIIFPLFDIMEQILREHDPQLFTHFKYLNAHAGLADTGQISLHFTLAWLLTFFAHSVNEFELLSRVFDVLVAECKGSAGDVGDDGGGSTSRLTSKSKPKSYYTILFLIIALLKTQRNKIILELHDATEIHMHFSSTTFSFAKDDDNTTVCIDTWLAQAKKLIDATDMEQLLKRLARRKKYEFIVNGLKKRKKLLFTATGSTTAAIVATTATYYEELAMTTLAQVTELVLNPEILVRFVMQYFEYAAATVVAAATEVFQVEGYVKAVVDVVGNYGSEITPVLEFAYERHFYSVSFFFTGVVCLYLGIIQTLSRKLRVYDTMNANE
ncbi:unnamed protein product [Amoebophrya sp. A120]|nr:unnamed protein product [Amoebophrya sp. A120]CAD7931852.1 unnamed protein product [Amoebophrya sp. A120]|eukprot:GSA120T00021089001.1